VVGCGPAAARLTRQEGELMGDDMPDLTAAIDQAIVQARDVAKVVASYWKSLIAEGVDGYDATKLTLAYQRRFLFGDQPDDTLRDDDVE
jgi:hypothetical protein